MIRSVFVASVVVAAASVVSCSNPGHVDPSMAGPDQIARACALIASCSKAHGSGSEPDFLQACVDTAQLIAAGASPGLSYRPLQGAVDCVAKSGTCQDLVACLGGPYTYDYCHESNGMGRGCEGTVAVDCTGAFADGLLRGYPVTFDCAKTGARCQVLNPNSPTSLCSTGNKCQSGFRARCDANRLIECDFMSGYETAFDCTDLGAVTCVGASGLTPAHCSLANRYPSCTTHGARCDGTSAVVCASPPVSQDLVEVRYDCAKIYEGHCDATITSRTPPCVPDTHECDRNSKPNCVGNQLRLCINGKYRSVDCTQLGFRSCQANSDATVVVCVP